MYKSTFYTMTSEGLKKQNGYSDNKWCYYRGFSNEAKINMWYVIDPLTGLSVCSDTSRDKAAKKAYNKEIIDKFTEFQKTKEYTRYVNNFYNAQVEAGIIMGFIIP